MKRDNIIKFLETWGLVIFAFLLFLICVALCHSQTVQQVRLEVMKYEVDEDHVDIIVAQSVLETGWYESLWCKNFENIFGLTTKVAGSRVAQVFSDWRYSVRSYYNQIYSRYKGGDYYVFLKDLPYAMDPEYIDKLKQIKDKI